jgi:hypothetical protein
VAQLATNQTGPNWEGACSSRRNSSLSWIATVDPPFVVCRRPLDRSDQLGCPTTDRGDLPIWARVGSLSCVVVFARCTSIVCHPPTWTILGAPSTVRELTPRVPSPFLCVGTSGIRFGAPEPQFTELAGALHRGV